MENLTGHKFPTGHPYRRAWLHVRVIDREGTTLFESGAVDDEGRIVGLREDYRRTATSSPGRRKCRYIRLSWVMRTDSPPGPSCARHRI